MRIFLAIFLLIAFVGGVAGSIWFILTRLRMVGED